MSRDKACSTTLPTLQGLPAPTRTSLRSTQILTSLPQIVSELLQNSLDAGSSHIEVGVNCEEWSCWVKDDGTGIPKDGLRKLAECSEQRRYHTSKAYDLNSLIDVSTFGFRGEALASAAEVSCLEVASRTNVSRECWSILVKGPNILYDGPSVRWRRETQGTVVCIRDAFFNIPVRRSSHTAPGKTLETIQRDIETYALMFPGVSFTLEDTNNRGASSTSRTTKRLMAIPKTTSTVASFRHMFGRALAEHVEEINVTSGDMALKGFISLEGALGKSYQFLYLNQHPIAQGGLHHVIESQFTASSFGKNAYDESGATSLPRSTSRRSPRKAQRHAVYCLDLTISRAHVDNVLEPAKVTVHFATDEAVSTFLRDAIHHFLVRNGFAQQRLSRSATVHSPLPKRLKTSHGEGQLTILARTGSMARPACQNKPSSLDAACTIIGDGQENVTKSVWTDPSTGEQFVVDTRTGFSYRRERNPTTLLQDGHEWSSGRDTYEGRRTLSAPWIKKLGDRHTGSQTVDTVPDWIRNALCANQSYSVSDPAIPTVPPHASAVSHSNHAVRRADYMSLGRCSQSHHDRYGHAPNKFGEPISQQLSAGQLARARVLGQVDRKFIACLLDAEADTRTEISLFLVDQHAADERVRVEHFLEELCQGYLRYDPATSQGVEVLPLDPPERVLLTQHEASVFARSAYIAKAFERWGFHITSVSEQDSSTSSLGKDYCQVVVHTVPLIVGQKVTQGNQLQEFVKTYIAQLTSEGEFASGPQTAEDPADEGSWQSALRWMPGALLEMVNSKACRGAIMFNDPLKKEQCERLIEQLSTKAFPFQCAHGRPSVAPLMTIANAPNPRRAVADWSRMDAFASPRPT
ncbi:hypothetical protein PUNSTDRAFT_125326 [Punctularia strigosozonata HHB-11173 SS5]|uniref:uncharacterized protein n=1 Tax=Punctularia strigosozonata (strain HHB-11173) TaxID=741275 RepID=UPI0004416826|nr:uncharacterized protein PUNSTDRAFT_125326 [Punctularia strigosozonata HHB-11173 SS5]EIN10511.1 hypothetical protein PUNSTDRAFT_125326 [Punctularia strigosozonata HHB-11173 SS5]